MMTQTQVLSILNSRQSAFITGVPGAGKTYVVNQFIEGCRERGIEPDVTASTGIAATHLGGTTIHAWSGIGILRTVEKEDVYKLNAAVRGRVRSAKILIIDEISMLPAKVLDGVDKICRILRREKNEPFGGLQVIFVGDFFQLPPVGGFDEDRKPIEADFAFESNVWKELKPKICYLAEQHRQSDPVFTAVLSAIRDGKVTNEHRKILQGRTQKEIPLNVTRLYTHNDNVDQLNFSQLMKLPGKTRTYTMAEAGDKRLLEILFKGCTSPQQLSLKPGAIVIFTKNDPMGRWVNGTVGEVLDCPANVVIVKLRSGEMYQVEPQQWKLQDKRDKLNPLSAEISQVPLRLAWAITVHKSQGMSLDAAFMDLTRSFEYGQGYVALSRVRTLDGLTIGGMNQKSLEVHPKVLEQDKFLQQESTRVRDTEDWDMHEHVLLWGHQESDYEAYDDK